MPARKNLIRFILDKSVWALPLARSFFLLGLAGTTPDIAAGEIPKTFVQSPYTHGLTPLIKQIKDRRGIQSIFKGPTPSFPLALRCVQTPGYDDQDNDLYIGVEQKMVVQASAQAVIKVVDDMNHYAEIFPGYEEIKIVEQTKNQVLLAWEQIIPLFFVPNIRYEMIYDWEIPKKDAKLYRYRLHKETTLKKSDGFLWIESGGPSKTYIYELDFFDAEWGAAKVLGSKKIWRESLEGVALSDLGIQLKAEHPDWDGDKVKEEAEKEWESLGDEKIDSLIRDKVPAPEILRHTAF